MDTNLPRPEMITVNTQIILGSMQRCWRFQQAAVVVPTVIESGQDSRHERRDGEKSQKHLKSGWLIYVFSKWSLLVEKRIAKGAAVILRFFLPVKIIY